MKVLVPVRADSPARTRSAIEAAIRLSWQEAGDFHVVLLSVQPQLSGHVAMYFPKGELSEIQEKAGRDDLTVARAMLDEARVPYTACVRVGRSAEAIAEVAQEYRCHRVLLGEEQGLGVAKAVFGSLAQQVREMLSNTAGIKVIAP
jgi:nucleotide-binding universal stress UspA family protein